MANYKVGVVGATGRGNYGHGVDTAWLDLPNTKIVAVADADEAGRISTAKRVGCTDVYADYREMMNATKPDIVAVCPRWLDQHADIMLEAVQRGIHCYVEKPFCRNLTEADAIVKACEMSHARVAVAHPTRYAPALQTIRRLISDGAIGQVVELRGRGKEDRRGGGEDLWVLGSHIMDMVLNLGFDPEWCFASVLTDGEPVTAANVYDGNEGIGPLAGDAVRATYGLRQGITYSFASYRHAGASPTRFALRVYGSEGIIEIQENVLPEVWILQSRSWNTGRGGGEWKRISSAGIDMPEPLTDPKFKRRHHVPIEDMLSAIEQRREPKCGVYEGRRIVEMIAAVFESHRVSGPVPLPLKTRVNPLTLMD
ncbi:MAG: Gfo/Idh/MocA family oxidoreductase [Fuerstiella sp.]|nr:Gfo/Idh/MocA family oxidoreductase [Fuerstiella sp.]